MTLIHVDIDPPVTDTLITFQMRVKGQVVNVTIDKLAPDTYRAIETQGGGAFEIMQSGNLEEMLRHIERICVNANQEEAQ